MKVCLLAYKKISFSKKYYLHLVEELKKKFDSVLLANIENVTLKVDSTGLTRIFYKNQKLDDFDVIIPRIGPSYVNFWQLIHQELKNNTYIPNSVDSYKIAKNKFLTLMKLNENNIPVPKTILSIDIDLAKKKLVELGEPLIIKKMSSSGGRGVIFSKDIKSANTVLDALPHKSGEEIFLEEYIPNPGEDIRLFVVGDEVVACAKRVAKKEDIRSNIHAGGTYKNYTPTAEMKRLALKSAKTIGADICGVDIIEGPEGPVIVEVNMNPGFTISDITGVNIAKRISDFIYAEANLFWKRKRNKLLYDKLSVRWENVVNNIIRKFNFEK